MDLYSIKWILSETLEVDEVLKCLEIPKTWRRNANPPVIHSVCGVYYTSNKYWDLTADIICSYSRKDNRKCMYRII